MIQPPARDNPVGPRGEWLVGAASAYMTVLWGSLAVIWLTVGNTPTLDATRPGGSLVGLALVAAGGSYLGRGTAGIGGAIAGAASAYALAIITTLRSAERNWAFIAPGPASAWRTDVTQALLVSLVVLGVAACIGSLGRELRAHAQSARLGASRPHKAPGVGGIAAALLVGLAALGSTSALVAAASETSIVLPAQVPAITATGKGPVVTVVPSSIVPGEVMVVRDNDWHDACAMCVGTLEFVGPLSEAQLAELQIGRVVDDWINRLPRPDQLWYGGVLLSEGTYAFGLVAYLGPDEPPQLAAVGSLTVSAGPAPSVATRTPGDARPFVWAEGLVVIMSGVAIGLVIFRRRRIARLAARTRWLAALGLAVLSSLFLAGGLAFYVQFAGSPF